jgi:hypothetical protein
MWMFTGEPIEPLDVGPFELDRHREGWNRLP